MKKIKGYIVLKDVTSNQLFEGSKNLNFIVKELKLLK